MKIYISGYRDHWLSPFVILEKVLFWKDDIYEKKPPKWLQTICEHVKWVLDKIHPYVNYVKIDKYDTWSMDSTLAHIILPMLKQLKATKHGAPFVDDMDVPDILKSTSAAPKENDWDTDANWHLRFDWVLGEMIFAFQSDVDDTWEARFRTGESDWEFIDREDGTSEMVKGANDTTEYDWDGLKAYQDRMQNGFSLLGRYYSNLWD